MFTNESHLVDRIQISEPLGKSDHGVLEFDHLCCWTCKLASTKQFVRDCFTGLSSHLAKIIHPDGSVNELFIRIQSAIHETGFRYNPRKPVKQRSVLCLLRRIRRLLDSHAHLFAMQQLTQSAEDIAAYRKVCSQWGKEIRAHQKTS